MTTTTTTTTNIPAIGIDVRSIARFVRQFEIAVNITTRTENEATFTFVLMMALPLDRRHLASLYAIRFFRGIEAENVSNMLDHVYRMRDITADDSEIVQTRLDRRFYQHWITEFPNAKFVPSFPHVYLFFFTPETYCTPDIETRIQQLRASPSLERDVYTIERNTDPPPNNNVESLDDSLSDERLAEKSSRNHTVAAPPSVPAATLGSCGDLRENIVDLEGFREWLESNQQRHDRCSLTTWIEAHHRVDRVLFDRDRLERMFSRAPDDPTVRGLPLISRQWTLPFLRLLMSRKINDILAAKLSRTPIYTHVEYELGLNRLRIDNKFRVSQEQCRSRYGFNIVLPAEWIESTVVPWCALFEPICAHTVRPSSDFTCLQLYNNEHPIARRTTSEHFWTIARSIARDDPGRKDDDRFVTLQRLFADNDKRLMPPPPLPPPSTSTSSSSPLYFLQNFLDNVKRCGANKRKRASYRDGHYFAVDDRLYGENTDHDETTSRRTIRFVSSYSYVPKRDKAKTTRKFVVVAKNDEKNDRAEPASFVRKFQHWEQAVLLDLGLHFCDTNHTINVNGDPGTGKSTVLWFLLQLFARPLCAVPTNKMKHQFAEKMKSLWSTGCLNCSATSVQTVSGCVKRLGCFRLPPQVYSKILVNCFADSTNRLSALLRQSSSKYDHELFNTGLNWGVQKSDAKIASTTVHRHTEFQRLAANKRFCSPDIVLLDEFNMCLWQHVVFLAQGLRRLRCPLITFGDGGQNRPIDATSDNAEMIAFGCGGLTVQLLANKRLMTNADNTTLSRVLRDNAWQLVTSDDNATVNAAIGNYLRALLTKHFRPLIDRQRLDIGREVRAWCDKIDRLHGFYTQHPCYRYANTVEHALAIAANVPRIPQWFLIAQTNHACDRFNYYYMLAHHRELMQRVFHKRHPDRSIFVLYSLAMVRQCYLPRDRLVDVAPQNIVFDEPTYDPTLESARTSRDDRRNQPNVRGNITDDPWTSLLRLCVGFRYTYLGNAKCIASGSTLRLLAILPDIEKNQNFVCERNDCATCRARRQIGPLLRPSGEISAISGLLMELIRSPANDESATVVSPNDLVIVTQEYYRVSRYNSLWCDSIYRKTDRTNAFFYGYPLRAYNSVTTYKVQGETLYQQQFPFVCLDVHGMQRESLLVAMSRFTDDKQLQSILNVETCCCATTTTTAKRSKIME